MAQQDITPPISSWNPAILILRERATHTTLSTLWILPSSELLLSHPGLRWLCFQFVSVFSVSTVTFASHIKTFMLEFTYLLQRKYRSGEMYRMTFPSPWPKVTAVASWFMSQARRFWNLCSLPADWLICAKVLLHECIVKPLFGFCRSLTMKTGETQLQVHRALYSDTPVSDRWRKWIQDRRTCQQSTLIKQTTTIIHNHKVKG